MQDFDIDFQLKTPRCPECGELAAYTIEIVPARQCIGLNDDGVGAWSLPAPIHEECKTALGPTGGWMVECENGHEWESHTLETDLPEARNPFEMDHHDVARVVYSIQRWLFGDNDDPDKWNPEKEVSGADTVEFLLALFGEFSLTPKAVVVAPPAEEITTP